jgi:hypothetical protein
MDNAKNVIFVLMCHRYELLDHIYYVLHIRYVEGYV